MVAPLHPVLAAAAVIDEALKSVADVNPVFMTIPEKATALVQLTELASRLGELRMRVLAVATDVAETNAARDPAAWVAHATRSSHQQARAHQRLAAGLEQRTVLAAAVRDGAANLAQARVVTRALDALPDHVPAEVVAQAEEVLVGHCATFGLDDLTRLARRILHTIAPEIADAADAAALARLEQAAAEKTKLSLRRQGDGTTRISGLIPDADATRLAVYLEAFTNPRTPEQQSQRRGDPFTRLPHPRKLGQAFCQLLEAIDPMRLPVHGGDATTLTVTITLDDLLADLGTATVMGAGTVPGETAWPDTGQTITAAHARRLACQAQIIPAVLDGTSEVLDLGRAQRLFTKAQRRALLIRDKTCRAEGCNIPGTWAEAHHLIPWSRGGPTDLANALLLCSHHHHRAHDPAYDTARLASGDVRFNRRR